MPAKSFIGALEEAARHAYATLQGEVSDANVRGYMRAATQIEEVWQQTDTKLADILQQGTLPWDAYSQLQAPFAFIRAARTYQVFVQQLLAEDAAAPHATAGYLPRVTYDQANALAHQIQPNLQHAVASLADLTHVPEEPLPMTFGPRIEAQGHLCPLPHLQGMIAAAREVREWTAGLIAQYETAVTHTPTPAPADITAHLAALHGQMAEADSQLQFGTDLVGQISQIGATPELHEEAEDQLWGALNILFLINQVIAMPRWHERQTTKDASAGKSHKTYHDRPITPNELWRVAAPSARAELRGTAFGNDEITEMCGKMGGILSAGAQQYLDEVDAAVQRGDVSIMAAMANCPFEPLYRTRVDLDLGNTTIPAKYEFHWDFHRGHIESSPRFARADNWQECAE